VRPEKLKEKMGERGRKKIIKRERENRMIVSERIYRIQKSEICWSMRKLLMLLFILAIIIDLLVTHVARAQFHYSSSPAPPSSAQSS
jgi:hypothetical protein